jgi:hypothetical protein
VEKVKARANRGQHTRLQLLLSPVTMRTPVSVSTVESVRTIEAKPWSIVAIARGNDYANYWRRDVENRARWWRRIIVRRCGSAVRLNHFGAGIRAQSRRKPECKHRQCYHNKFLPHERTFLLLFGRLNPGITAKLPKELVPCLCLPGRVRSLVDGTFALSQMGCLRRRAAPWLKRMIDLRRRSRSQRLQFGGFGRYFFSTSERYAS